MPNRVSASMVSNFFIKISLPKRVRVGTAGARSSPFYLYCGDFFDTLREVADKLNSFADKKEVVALFTSIAFYIGEKVLGLNDREYPLVELTAEVLNISPEEYQELHRTLGRAMENMDRYEKNR